MSQAQLQPQPAGSITLEQLLALNEEIRALVRAGIPLERGLMVAGWDLRGRLGRITSALGRRLERGESLVEALEAEKKAIPPLYRAVVGAGARSGRLPVALEGLARYVRGYSEARSAIGLALWYPLLILSLAYILFLWLVAMLVPRFVSGFNSLGLTEAAPLRWLQHIGSTAEYWWWIGPVLLVVLTVAWIQSGRAAQFRSRAWGWLRLFPWMRSLLADYETANFSDLLGLLLEHQVAYPSALVLAAESTGDARLTRGARELAGAVARGDAAEVALGTIDRGAFPPMLRWVLATGEKQGSLVAALRNLTEFYRNRAKFKAEKLNVFLPTALMLIIGASAVCLYGLAVFLPVINMLYELGRAGS